MAPEDSPFTIAAEAADEAYADTGSMAIARDTYRRVLREQLRQCATARVIRRAGIIAAIRRNRAIRDRRRLVYRVRLLGMGGPR